MKEKFRLFDYINIGFYLFMLTIAFTHYNDIPSPNAVILLYIFIIITSIYLIIHEHSNRLLRLLRFFYPFVFIGFVFESLGFIVPFINPHNKDYLLIRWDRMLLGEDAARLFNIFNIKGFVDILQIAYLAYYFLPFVVIVYFYKRNEIKKLSFSLFALSLGYYISYLGYILLPAIGPRYSLSYLSQMPINGGIVYKIVHPLLNALEHIKQDCFPSGHTEISLLVVLIFWRENKKIALFILPVVLLLILATLVLRYHYFSDVVAGIFTAFFVYFTSRAIFKV
ncbi:phosphatase PAP2 family protein [Hippea jasoniae]|uniref:phosphatase PAP2 family protein n=1 Tax=Hippea jasoniae TaxID=944479 RepID=UPI00054EAE8A|nr:phosphatase PAP2 family protein [Hippea jasoniae]